MYDLTKVYRCKLRNDGDTESYTHISKRSRSPKARSPEEASSVMAAVAVVDSSPDNNHDNITLKQSKKRGKPEKSLCTHPSCTKRAQEQSPLCWKHDAQARNIICKFTGCNKKGILQGLCPDHGGLVQLCQWKGCINQANLEKRGGLCWMHRAKGQHNDDDDYDDSSEEEEAKEIRLCRIRGCISCATTCEGLCDRHSAHENNGGVVGEKKRSHQRVDSISDGATKKRRKEGAFFIDLTDVPPQPPGHMKSGTSKYTGTRFNEKMKKWTAQIKIDGKVRRIGSYEHEEEAAVDYARALFKYRGQGELDKATEHQEELVTVIDISDVPPQPPILKTAGRSGASKYTGVSFVKKTNKWSAQIMIGKKQNCIGYYDNEEDAAVDYARALFKYKRNVITRPPQNSFIIDLDDVPPQPLILKNDLSRSKKYNDNTRRRNVNKGSSKYTGVYFAKDVNKWKAQIMIDGNVRSIGYYEIEEEAAADYARAAFKYKAKKGYATYGGLDLNDIPDQPLIHSETNKSGFKGVKKNKSRWEARFNGKTLGTFDTKEEAAGIYARARYYVESQEKQSKKEEQKAAVALTEESFESVAV